MTHSAKSVVNKYACLKVGIDVFQSDRFFH